MDEERTLARCRNFDIGFEDHGCLVFLGHFEYEESGCQGFGYVINTEFVRRFLNAVGVDAVKKLEGKSCWVTHTFDGISKIEPLHKKDGKAFDIRKWQEECKKKSKVSA